MSACMGCGVEFPPDGGSGVYGFCLTCREAYVIQRHAGDQPTFTETSIVPGPADFLCPTPPPVPTERWEAELARAKSVQAKDVDTLITRTPRKRSRWGRPWERKR